MFPAAPAAPFARNVACRGVLVIHISDFQDLLCFATFSYVVLQAVVLISRCVTEALRYVTVIHDLSRLLVRSITARYVLLRSVTF